jgi:hypothetical protein
LELIKTVAEATVRGPDGIERQEKFDRRSIVPYSHRHSYAQRHADEGVQPDVLRDLMGTIPCRPRWATTTLADTTIREQWERAQKINIRGEPVNTSTNGPLAEAAWMKQNLSRAKMALPNGYCGLPMQKSCPHANACLTCLLFVTTAEFLPQHHHQLAATRALITRNRRPHPPRRNEPHRRDGGGLG